MKRTSTTAARSPFNTILDVCQPLLSCNSLLPNLVHSLSLAAPTHPLSDLLEYFPTTCPAAPLNISMFFRCFYTTDLLSNQPLIMVISLIHSLYIIYEVLKSAVSILLLLSIPILCTHHSF